MNVKIRCPKCNEELDMNTEKGFVTTVEKRSALEMNLQGTLVYRTVVRLQ